MWQTNRKSKIIAVLPAVLVMFFMCWFGIIFGILESLNIVSLTGQEGITLDFYREIVTRPYFKTSFLFSLKTAFTASALSGVAAITILYMLFLLDSPTRVTSERYKNLFILPMFLPYIAAAYLVSIMFSQGGWTSSVFYQLGIIDSTVKFPVMVNDIYGLGIIMAYVWKTAPFIILITYPVMRRAQGKLESAALMLGAGKYIFFIKVILPVILPVLTTALMIIFTFIFSAYEVPFILGVTYPKSIAVLSYELYSRGNVADRGVLTAVNIIITCISAFFGVLIYIISKNLFKNRRGWE